VFSSDVREVGRALEGEMDRLRNVLGHKSGQLARAVEVHVGIESAAARRFVEIVGEDLIEAYLWQRADIDAREPTDPTISRDVMSGAYAAHIARELGISRSTVWEALRAFVPSVLSLASASPRSPIRPPSLATLHRSRSVAGPLSALLHPLEQVC
jgi:hypothetical protein